MEQSELNLLYYKASFFLFLLIVLTFIQVFIISGDKEQVYHETSENFVYKSKNYGDYRLKTYSGYEYVGELDKNNYIYKIELGNEKVGNSEYKVYHEREIPEVSKAFRLRKDEILTTDLIVEFNSKVDREFVRADVRVVVEELRKGKWVEVHQAIFKERGPYWSLDKGPVEIIKQGED